MGRVEPVKLQLRTAEVWLTTSGGSATMVGASHKKIGKQVNLCVLKRTGSETGGKLYVCRFGTIKKIKYLHFSLSLSYCLVVTEDEMSQV